jgi:hypothetical protein
MWKSAVFSVLQIFVGTLLASCGLGQAQWSAPAAEYQVKAAFLLNFARFVQWPDTGKPGGPLIIAVLGRDPFGPALEQTIRGKSVNGRELELRYVDRSHNLKGCHVVFVSSSESRHTSEILQKLSGSYVLTVGETDDFTQEGGVIRLLLDGSHVRFDVNRGAAAKNGLKVSSKLLSLARELIE